MRKWVKVRDFFRSGTETVAANGSATLVSESVPAGLVLKVNEIATNASSIYAWPYVIFRAKVNGVPQFPLHESRQQLGQLNAPIRVEDIEAPGGSIFTLTGENTSPSDSYSLGVLVRGEYGYYA